MSRKQTKEKKGEKMHACQLLNVIYSLHIKKIQKWISKILSHALNEFYYLAGISNLLIHTNIYLKEMQ